MVDDQQDEPELTAASLPRMLNDTTDLGPARGKVEITVSLKDSTRPGALTKWGEHHGLSVEWREGDTWAYVSGTANNVASALGVDIHDYRGTDDNVFYASRQEPTMPAPLRDEVAEIGTIMGDTPLRRTRENPHN